MMSVTCHVAAHCWSAIPIPAHSGFDCRPHPHGDLLVPRGREKWTIADRLG
jgi:hypothetical protein